MKGFVFISGSETALRFLYTGAFSDLAGKHDLTYVMFRSPSIDKEGGGDLQLPAGLEKIEWVPFYPGRFHRWQELFNISCIFYKDRSSSFRVRFQESAHLNPDGMARLERKAHAGIYEKNRAATEKEMGLHPDILALVLRERPDFFVLPSFLLDHCTDDVLQIADALSIPTVMLIGGWDNLSSKGLISHQPTVMGVWGEQSRRHAIEIQGTDSDRVHVVGASMYDSFYPDHGLDRGNLRATFGVPREGRLLLFAGTFRLFDETALLSELEQSIDSGAIPPMHILYRPHPWRSTRQSEENFLAHPWRHITMDPEMVDVYRTAKSTANNATPDDFSFRLKHLTQIYQMVDAVISPMSTILLESLLFGLPTMAVTFGDGKHSWSADKVSQMHHFKELYEVPGIMVCRSRQEFFPMVRELTSLSSDVILHNTLRENTKQFVYRDDRSYSKRVLELVDLMFIKHAKSPIYDTVNVKPGKTFSPNLMQCAWSKTRKAIRKVERALRGEPTT